MNKPDFLRILNDVTNYSFTRFQNEVCKNIDQSEAVVTYFSQWAKAISAKLDHENLEEYPTRYYEILFTYCNARIDEEAELKAKISKEPKRVAKIVTFEVAIRVIINENKEMPEVEYEDAYNAAIERIKSDNNVEHWICMDNCTDVVDDDECPFGIFDNDK